MSDDWLQHLERTVHEASETIESLRREKRELTDRIGELEGALEKARSEAESKAESKAGKSKKAAGSDEAARAWREERQEIRRRVESLTDKLEGLLDDGA